MLVRPTARLRCSWCVRSWLGLLLVMGIAGPVAGGPPTRVTPAKSAATATTVNDTSNHTSWSRRGGGVATIAYTLPRAGRVSVRVFDIAGREVARPVRSEWQPAGAHTTMFAFGPSEKEQVFRYLVQCDGRKRSGRIVVAP